MMVRTSTFLDPDVLPTIDRVAKHYGISRSEWIRRAITHALEHEMAQHNHRRSRPEFRIIDGGKFIAGTVEPHANPQ